MKFKVGDLIDIPGIKEVMRIWKIHRGLIFATSDASDYKTVCCPSACKPVGKPTFYNCDVDMPPVVGAVHISLGHIYDPMDEYYYRKSAPKRNGKRY